MLFTLEVRNVNRVAAAPVYLLRGRRDSSYIGFGRVFNTGERLSAQLEMLLVARRIACIP